MSRFVDGAEIDEWLRLLGESLRTFVGFRGLWLHGSAATGDWVAGVSDIDLLVIWNLPLESERPALSEAIHSALAACPTASADIHVVTLAVAEQPTPDPIYELFGGIHVVDAEDPVLIGPSADASLLLDLESARSHGVAVVAGVPEVVFGTVKTDWLLAAADRELAQWEDYSYFRQPHMAVLQAARVWMLESNGELGSKLSSGRWAMQRWRSPEVLRAAIDRQLGNTEVVVDELEARALLAHVRSTIRTRLSRLSENTDLPRGTDFGSAISR